MSERRRTLRSYSFPALLALLLLSVQASQTFAASAISLAGQWQFQLDRSDVGISGHWFERALPDKIDLPGTLPLQSVGDAVTTNTSWTGTIVDQSWFTAPEYARYRQPGNVKVPFWLTPRKYYAGVAWYQREIEIPQDWSGKRVVLSLERPHWETRVWVDSQLVGTNNALATPHDYDLGQLNPGRHRITLRVDNRMVVSIGENSHSNSDHTQGNWNGIVGRMELQATPLVWIEELQVYPHLATKSALVRGRVGNATGKNVLMSVGLCLLDRFDARPRFPTTNVNVNCTPMGGRFEAEVKCGNEVIPWDEFNPHLYELTAQTGAFPNESIEKVIFGFREISARGTQFSLNGTNIFIRGTLDCAGYPRTGHPPTDVESWKRVIQIAKAYGLNEIRFHSWCPPEAAFVAADELGFYFHVEACSWANDNSTWLGDGQPVDAWIYAETDRILKYYGNHPSFLLMVYGNEPGGKNHAKYLATFVDHYRSVDNRRLWSSGAGWPELPQNQWHNIPEPRIQAWGAGLKSRINARAPETTTDYRANIARRSVPVVSHEIGQWCVYPNFDEIRKYTSYLKPGNFEIFRDFLTERGLGELGREFLLASGKLQTLCYKEEIESALRTPGMGGFELLDLHDFPGQGTALVGVLDAFWEEKGYVTPKKFNRFCNSTVPLARLKKRVFTTSETLEADIGVSNFGPTPVEKAQASWKLVSEDGKAVAHGGLRETAIPTGDVSALGQMGVELKPVPAPARYKLVVSVDGGKFENDWDVWVYPARTEVEAGKNVLVTSQFDKAAEGHLKNGGNLLLTIPGKQVRNFDTAPVRLGFSTIFWNTAWTHRQAPTTMGILCDPKHPALAEFPTDFHSNWQWWYLLHRAGTLRLDLLPPDLRPIVRVIDDWFTARPLGLVVEGKVGPGKIVMCGFDLTSDSDDPVSKQMRASLLRYMGSNRFKPVTELTAAQITSLFTMPVQSSLRGVRSVTADSEEEGTEAVKALDGDPDTFWHTSWSGQPTPFPHELTVQLLEPRALAGVKLLPRQDGNHNGWIKDCEVYVSADGRDWGQPVAKATLPATANEHEIKFKQPLTMRFVKLRALSGYADGPWASLAELRLMAVEK